MAGSTQMDYTNSIVKPAAIGTFAGIAGFGIYKALGGGSAPATSSELQADYMDSIVKPAAIGTIVGIGAFGIYKWLGGGSVAQQSSSAAGPASQGSMQKPQVMQAQSDVAPQIALQSSVAAEPIHSAQQESQPAQQEAGSLAQYGPQEVNPVPFEAQRQWDAAGYDTTQGNPGIYAAYLPYQDQPLRVGEERAMDRLCGNFSGYRNPRYGHNLTDVQGAFRYVPVGGDIYSLHQQEATLAKSNQGSAALLQEFEQEGNMDKIAANLDLKSNTRWVEPRGMEPIAAVVITAPESTSPVVPIAPIDVVANPDDGMDNFWDPDNGIPGFQLRPDFRDD
jgi:hypothetical protein